MKTITLTLGDIGLILVLSTLVAVVVQFWFQSRTKAEAGTPTKSKPMTLAPQAAATGISQEHLAVITAAVATMLGTHRIVHIEAPNRGFTWTAEARTVHHTSHATR